MDERAFRDLGRAFCEWHISGRVIFLYGTESRSLNTEIERLSRLVEYVKNKRAVSKKTHPDDKRILRREGCVGKFNPEQMTGSDERAGRKHATQPRIIR